MIEIAKVKCPAKQRPTNLPEHVAAAREIRDVWLEQMNAENIVEAGKYSPARCLEEKRASLGVLAMSIMASLPESC